MVDRISRRRIAVYAADRLLAGEVSVIQQIAAFLIEERRTREADVLVREIESELAHRGHIIADVYSAHALTASVRQSIERLLAEHYAGDDITLRAVLDSTLLGGVRVETSDAEYDGSLRARVTTLKQAKI